MQGLELAHAGEPAVAVGGLALLHRVDSGVREGEEAAFDHGVEDDVGRAGVLADVDAHDPPAAAADFRETGRFLPQASPIEGWAQSGAVSVPNRTPSAIR